MNKNKSIWIINQYASTPDYGYAGRSYYFAKELANSTTGKLKRDIPLANETR